MEHTKYTPPNICQDCGSRIPGNAKKCLVCGKEVTASSSTRTSDSTNSPNKISGKGMPAFNFTPTMLFLLFFVFIFVGGGIVYSGLNSFDRVIEIEDTATVTATSTQASTPTPAPPTQTNTPQPTNTPLSYVVQDGDTCLGLALFYGISQQTLILVNNLSSSCILPIGVSLTIPQPTFTPTPIASGTPSNIQMTVQSCEINQYVVQEGDSIQSISSEFQIPSSDIISWNGISSPTLFPGQTLKLPICRQNFPEAGNATTTPTPYYNAPILLLPKSGESFTLLDDVIPLQWSGFGALNTNEYYQVSVTDLSLENSTTSIYLIETKANQIIFPTEFRPSDGSTHIYQWVVNTVRLNGKDENGEIIYQAAGKQSELGYFSWSNINP